MGKLFYRMHRNVAVYISQATLSMKKSKRYTITLDGMTNRISAVDKTSFLMVTLFLALLLFT